MKVKSLSAISMRLGNKFYRHKKGEIFELDGEALKLLSQAKMVEAVVEEKIPAPKRKKIGEPVVIEPVPEVIEEGAVVTSGVSEE